MKDTDSVLQLVIKAINKASQFRGPVPSEIA